MLLGKEGKLWVLMVNIFLLEDRKIIEENICKGLRKFETANQLNKSQSTRGKEIKNNRKRRYRALWISTYYMPFNKARTVYMYNFTKS